MKSPVFSGKKPGGDTRVLAQYGKGKALVKDKQGKRMLLVSSQPLQTKNPQGMLAPVDLSLQKTAAGIGPVNSQVPFVVDAMSAAKVTFTGLGIGMKLAGAQDQSGK